MTRLLIGTGIGLVIFVTSLLAQEGIQKGKIKKVDAEKGIITVTVDGKEEDLAVTEATRIVDGAGQDVQERLKDERLKAGVPVMFKVGDKDGKQVLLGLKLAGGNGRPGPGGDIQRGKVKKIDLDKKNLTLTLGDHDRDFVLTEDTKVLGASGKDLEERLKDFKPGSEIFFKVERRDGKDVIVGLKLADGGRQEGPPQADTSKLKPLTDMGKDEYQGFHGGLYPDGKNERPAAHDKAGLALAGKVQPLDADGKPSADGKIVLLTVGMSNTAQASAAFKQLADADREKNPKVVIVNGAQGGMTASAIQDADDNGRGTRYWTEVDNRLKAAGVSRAQVQAVWIKQADAGPSQGFPKYAQTLQAELARIVQLLPRRFPKVKLVYLSSRTYGGYARTRLNPEPYAYESGFSVKWLIEQQLKGDPELAYEGNKLTGGSVKAPWLSWGPYLWANGTTRRADGFSYDEADFAGDGTHESASGQQKVGKLLLQFFKTDPTTRGWFRGQ